MLAACERNEHLLRIGQLPLLAVQVAPEPVVQRNDVDDIVSSGLEGNILPEGLRLVEFQLAESPADLVVQFAHGPARLELRVVVNGPDPARALAGVLQHCGGNGRVRPYGQRERGETPAAPFQRFPGPGGRLAQIDVEGPETALLVSAF